MADLMVNLPGCERLKDVTAAMIRQSILHVFGMRSKEDYVQMAVECCKLPGKTDTVFPTQLNIQKGNGNVITVCIVQGLGCTAETAYLCLRYEFLQSRHIS